MPIDKDKIAPIKTTGYYKIYNNEITFQDNKNFDIYINFLILGEVKSDSLKKFMK